jgi:putative transposase
MSQSLSRIYTHVVFSTKNRYPFLTDPAIRDEMHAYIGGTCNTMGCRVIIVGGIADHVHILCMLSKNISPSDLVGAVKRNSSRWVKINGRTLTKFAWQNGYGVFSVSQSQVLRVRDYIVN